VLSSTINRALNEKKRCEVWSTNTRDLFTRLMFTHPRSTVRVLRILMHLCACHVTLLPGWILPPPWIFPQSDLGRRADSRWALPQISSWFPLYAVLVDLQSLSPYFLYCHALRIQWDYALSIILYTVSQNIEPRNCCPYLRQSLTDSKNSFAGTLCKKFEKSDFQ